MLARSGMTGPETSLEGRHGLFRQFTGDEAAAGRFRGLIADLGRKWHLPNAAYKFYPVLPLPAPVHRGGRQARRARRARRATSSGSSAACRRRSRRDLRAVGAQAGARDNGHAARWSLPIAVAAQLMEGKIDLATFETPASAAVREPRAAHPVGAAARCALPRALRGRGRLRDETRRERDGAHRRRIRQPHPPAGRRCGPRQVPRQRRALAARPMRSVRSSVRRSSWHARI